MLAVDKLRALYQRAGMSAADSNAAVRNTPNWMLALGIAPHKHPYEVLAWAFVWSDSPEGPAHWKAVYERLAGAAK